MRYCWLLIFALAAILWSVGIGRPVDLPNWHEFDYASIARNFQREGSNILFPRIDWRGDGPGFTEMEFPLIPWVMGQLYLLFGNHEVIGRILSLLAMLLSLWVLRALALKVLPEPAALIASLFFLVSHLVVIVATAIQPESLMLLFYLMAVYYYVDWYERKTALSYALATLSFAAAILVKSPAAHLAVFFFLWAILQDGRRAFRRPLLYLFAALSFAPAAIWYGHAASLWQHFHNSMGVSNEDHWPGMDLLKRPKVLANLVSIDFIYLFGGGGVLVVLAGLLRSAWNSAVNRLALCWCLAITIYLFVIIRTAGANWAAYYHVVAVPPIALLFAAGLSRLCRTSPLGWRTVFLWMLPPALLLALGLFWIEQRATIHMPGVVQDLVAARLSIVAILVLLVLAMTVTVLAIFFARSLTVAHGTPALRPGLRDATIVIGCFTYFFFSGDLLLGTWKTFAVRTTQFDAAKVFKAKLSAPGLIVASGGICTDPGGHRVANDAPDMFYWLDRKGFTTCAGQETIAELQADEKRGARYFVADKTSLDNEPGFESALRRSFVLLDASDAALLFDLKSRPH